MKRKNIILILITSLLLTVCCRKEEKDYREKWTGEYIGEYIYTFAATGIYHNDTTNNAILNVVIWSDSGLFITHNNRQWSPKINTNGYFEQYNESTHHYYYGNIQGDNILMEGENRPTSGSVTRWSYKGKKYNK